MRVNNDNTNDLSRQGPTIAVISGLLLLSTAIVYVTGGTSYAFPYLQLIPVLVAAARYEIAGGLIVGVIASLLLGPYMPMDVDAGTAQSTTNWLTRMVFFLLLGGMTGWLFAQVRAKDRQHDRLARVDRATGLPNQTALEEKIDATIANQPVLESTPPILFIVRITDFFEALDAVGADAGDELAAGTARLIESANPGLGPAYRFSAAELAFVTGHIAPEELASRAAEIKTTGEDPVNVRDVPVRVELCVGAEKARDEDAGRPYELVRRARLALFAAQDRNQDFAIFEPAFERSTRETFMLITRMRQAIKEEQFELFYQPKIRLSDGMVTGVEALIRWRDPVQGIVPPGQFIPKVERTSLIGPLTRFACHEACLFARRHPGLSIGVNISPRSLYDHRLMDELCEMIERFQVTAPSIEIEITEGTLAHDPGRAAKLLTRLRDYGVGISIDDFGTGYSSFSYLHHLPVTGLKIDRSFMTELNDSRQVKGIIRCIAGAGHELGLDVTAEGVETETQLGIVQKTGCDMAQGYYFTVPMPEADMDQWLADYRPESISQSSLKW